MFGEDPCVQTVRQTLNHGKERITQLRSANAVPVAQQRRKQQPETGHCDPGRGYEQSSAQPDVAGRDTGDQCPQRSQPLARD